MGGGGGGLATAGMNKAACLNEVSLPLEERTAFRDGNVPLNMSVFLCVTP